MQHLLMLYCLRSGIACLDECVNVVGKAGDPRSVTEDCDKCWQRAQRREFGLHVSDAADESKRAFTERYRKVGLLKRSIRSDF